MYDQVVSYRVLQGCRGCFSSCMSLPLEQTICIWQEYRAVLARDEDVSNLPGEQEILVTKDREKTGCGDSSNDILVKSEIKLLLKTHK